MIIGRTARRARRALLIAVLSLACTAAASAGGLYSYLDDRGVMHFSDVPHDGRYQRINLKPRTLALTPESRTSAPIHHTFDALIAYMAHTYGVDPALVKAVVAAESNFDVDAISHAGAQGLMQLMPGTAETLGVQAPLEPVENLKGGVKYLREMLDRYGDVSRALAAYNAGPTAVDRYNGIPPYPETETYVTRVLNYYRGYQGQFSKRSAPAERAPSGEMVAEGQ
jgi:soluble lytic murein transglycosylase